MEIVTEQLTHLRLQLDRIFKSLEEANGDFDSGFPSGALMGTKMAFMWLGKAKGISGSANPYPESTDASSKRIEPAVDQYEGDIIVNDNDIAFIKTLRGELDTVENNIRNGLMPYMHANRFFQKALENAWTNVCEAKMFLGLALGEIRDQQVPQEEKETSTPQETPSLGTTAATPEPGNNLGQAKIGTWEEPQAEHVDTTKVLTVGEVSAQSEAEPEPQNAPVEVPFTPPSDATLAEDPAQEEKEEAKPKSKSKNKQ